MICTPKMGHLQRKWPMDYPVFLLSFEHKSENDNDGNEKVVTGCGACVWPGGVL